MPRRVHSKISELPAELREAVHALLLKGDTYEDIVAFLREKGAPVGRSSVGRYGKEFSKRLQRLREVKEQAQAIVEKVGDRPATEMQEAANQLATQKVFERLLEADDDLAAAKIEDVILAVSRLEKSAVARERAKLQFKKAADDAAGAIEKIAKKEGISAEALKQIRERVYGIVK